MIACSVREAEADACKSKPGGREIVCLQPLRFLLLTHALFLAIWRLDRIATLLIRILLRGNEPPKKRFKALLHTGLGVYFAVRLRKRGVDHIHVHHGYFGSWIAMTAARILGVSYSLTLHGSDLLVHGAYLDTKLKHCRFCATISEYNRRYILRNFPRVNAEKVKVLRLGVCLPNLLLPPEAVCSKHRTFTLLAVGRLHRVKDHEFLIQACAVLRDRGMKFACAIAGDGPERLRLAKLIQHKRLDNVIALLGHVEGSQLHSAYGRSDVIVLTSRSEGIPLVLMEAMAQGKPVIAPAITGIPELVIPGKTGFLYAPGNLADFAETIMFLQKLIHAERALAIGQLAWVRHAARVQVLHNFNSRKNLSHFSNQFLDLISTRRAA